MMSQQTRSTPNRGSDKSETRLITRACDTCRRRKIRCEPIQDSCVHCVKSKALCHFTPISVLKGRRWMTRDRRVEELENRLAWMEGQLQHQVLGRQHHGELQPGNGSEVHGTSGLREHFSGKATSQVFVKSSLSSGASEEEGFTRVSGISHITSLSQPLLPYGSPGLSLGQNTTLISDKPPIFQALPSKEEALRLINIYFHGLNTIHPIFSQTSFLSKFHTSYNPDIRHSDPSWWAALNIVLALSYQYWELPDPDSREDLEAWGYFQNAFACTGKLVMGEYSLASVQALLGMALMIMTAWPHQRPIGLLVSSAVGIAHHLELHRKRENDALGAAQGEERTRVFWLAYILDKDMSLQTRQPPTQSDEDMDIQPPSKENHGPLQLDQTYHDLLFFRTRLAIIQGQIYRRLLSVRAEKRSAHERATTAGELESALQTWRMQVPIELFCDYPGPFSEGYHPDTYRHPVYLQLLYFKTLAVIHEPLFISSWQHEIQSSEVRVHVLSARVTYPADARSAMRLFNVTPRRKFTCIWCTLHIFLTAATTLLSYTVSNTSSSHVQADLELLSPFLDLLGVIAKSGRHDEAAQKYPSILKLFDQAKTATKRIAPEVISRQNEAQANAGARESIEEFLERMERVAAGDSAAWEDDGVH